MDKFLKLLNIERFGFWFILFGLLTQILTYCLTEDTLLSFISGCAGVVSVVLCSQRKVSFYIWGFIQLGTFVVICFQEQLYGKLFENLFYAVTMIIGIVVWIRNKNDEDVVVTRELIGNQPLWLTLGINGTIVIVYWCLNLLGDSQPLIDSISTVLAVVAQILMILRYKESWIYWFLVDLLCIIMFIIAANWCMVVQYIFWTVNCVYGYIIWSKKTNNIENICFFEK